MISKTLLPDIIGLNSAFVVTSNHKSMREAIEILRYAQNDISRVVILNRSRVTLNEVKSLSVIRAKYVIVIMKRSTKYNPLVEESYSGR